MNINYLILVILLIILLLILSKNNILTFNNIEKNNKISIVIPCIPRDIKYLDRLMESIKNQSYKPYEIIIALSGDDLIFNINKLNNLLFEKFNLPIKFSYHKKKCNASVNRNRGAKFCSGDIITFMDADDKMYPDKLSYINTYFNKNNPKLLLHAYSSGYDKFDFKKSFEIVLGKKLYDVAKLTENKILRLPIGDIAHGHSSISSDVINNINFREDVNIGEDTLFVRDILKFYGRENNTAIFINIPLSQYIPSKNQNLEKIE